MTTSKTLLYATGNAEKFAVGSAAFEKHGVQLTQVLVDIDEIQSENPQTILIDKAKKAYALIQKPVLVSDDSWCIPALGGFPGPYMKSINYWFRPEDFINLMRDKTNRTIYLDQCLAYIDGTETVTFTKRITGSIIASPRGNSGPPIMRVVEQDGDDMTISELFDTGAAVRHGTERDAWNDAAEWYANHQSIEKNLL